MMNSDTDIAAIATMLHRLYKSIDAVSSQENNKEQNVSASQDKAALPKSESC